MKYFHNFFVVIFMAAAILLYGCGNSGADENRIGEKSAYSITETDALSVSV